jgi:hypothetical protein
VVVVDSAVVSECGVPGRACGMRGDSQQRAERFNGPLVASSGVRRGDGRHGTSDSGAAWYVWRETGDGVQRDGLGVVCGALASA